METRMFILETLRRSFEQATGRGRPSSRQARQRVVGRRAKTCWFRDDGAIPNNAVLPFVYYRRAVRLVRVADPAAVLEQLFEANGWGDSWRNGIYDYVHYHANVHEVLGIARGRARVQFGGPEGDDFDLAAGDVAILPAGTGHRCLMASSDFLVVGAYPPGGEYDECRGSAKEHERALRMIGETPLPDKDPVYGAKGPLVKLWKTEE
jgi:uncharacterized protein YjlB